MRHGKKVLLGNLQDDDLDDIRAQIRKIAKGIVDRNARMMKMIDEYRARWTRE